MKVTVRVFSFVKNITNQNGPKPSGYWKNNSHVIQFLLELKQKYNLVTPDDFNTISNKHILANGGGTLLSKYSMYELKCMACPEGKSMFNNPKQSAGYWESEENVLQFLSELSLKYNLNTPEHWNSITSNHIKSNGGSTLLNKYSIYDLKCMVCPEGKSIFKNISQAPSYWENKENMLKFLSEIREKYNLNSSEDWNSITTTHIKSNGGRSILKKYSLYELKCMACPEGISIFKPLKQPPRYWENKENIRKFLSGLSKKYNLASLDDWNSITQKIIQSNGGSTLLNKYSIYELKCMACPEGVSIFKPLKQSPRYWENKENVYRFLLEIGEKYNLNTSEDWNSITTNHIKSNGGSTLFHKYSMYELKCMAFPDAKLIFNNSNQQSGYWEDINNILQFLSEVAQKYKLNSPEDWNLITHKHIHSSGGGSLFSKYSLYELKCLACPEGKSLFNIPPRPPRYWENKENIHGFFGDLKQNYNLNTPEDWKRISKHQIISHGGGWLFNGKNNHLDKIQIKFEGPNNTTEFIPLKKLLRSRHKRSSQRWLFLQIQKLFPNEEIVEDYFHSEISRISGFNVQFDIFMIERNIAIEYHGKQHYEDIPQAFNSVETYQHRDREKEKLCQEHGIQLLTIPYWWDNKLDSLRTFLYSKINFCSKIN